MISPDYIRNNRKEVQEGVRAKKSDIRIDDIIALDDEYKQVLRTTEDLRASRNTITEQIAAQKNSEARSGLLKKAEEIKRKVQHNESILRTKKEALDTALHKIPNIPSNDVPRGTDEDDNVVLRVFGEKPSFSFKPKDYLEIAKAYDLIDIDRAAKVSGTRFGYIKNQAALLEFALVRFVFDEVMKERFVPIVPPVLINKNAMQGLGYLEKDSDEAYYIEKDDLYLVATAEHSIVPMFCNEVIECETLPRRFIGFSSAFRREAGSYGKDTKGILRVHQFDKIEMVSFATVEQAEKEHLLMLETQERLMQRLEIPYRVVSICTGDMGFVAKRQYDIESWIPSQETYRETHSTSDTGDFQARRLNIRYRKDKANHFVHIANGTALAIGRILIALLENYQQHDGSVRIPSVLQPYTGFDRIS
ncbi:MAG: serine--tRNA ligase [Candidatus Spechtbacteria bacterium SB0662_bin_43]|uniref:Serine--tRNA ligase n=1 Tax=Candidatus Spechtbacteria bacterium SB0662_bin_43 TaxID=2604897 RepID=A0A845D944_9BACT|nr:serine--tRNA ligase [Candidatus Spechtbacteria bacterium SB0662_bin_43]